METELTLQLLRPVTLGDVEYLELSLSEPTVGDLIKAGKAGTQMEQIATLIQLNAKVPRGMVDKMGQRDMEAAASFLSHFSEPSPPTSAT